MSSLSLGTSTSTTSTYSLLKPAFLPTASYVALIARLVTTSRLAISHPVVTFPPLLFPTFLITCQLIHYSTRDRSSAASASAPSTSLPSSQSHTDSGIRAISWKNYFSPSSWLFYISSSSHPQTQSSSFFAASLLSCQRNLPSLPLEADQRPLPASQLVHSILLFI